MKRIFLMLFVVTLVLALSSCAGTGGSDTIKIGLEAPLTGDYAYEGQGFKNAVQLLVDQTNAAGGINGKKLQFLYEDDTGKPLLTLGNPFLWKMNQAIL